MEANRKKFGIELRDDLHTRLHANAVGRGLKLWQAFQQAVEAYLGVVEHEPSSDVPPKLRPYLGKFAKVLASGDETAIEATTKQLDFFLDRLRPGDRKKQ
jgi:hypothetical protein